ncbi:MAG: PQQ-dependent sugar dehydrogenase, partial [candidate division KSB1 bacterium]|nr:PQQ-dependent sugar dehydrogenase [candidate division KSB1 bacterium]
WQTDEASDSQVEYGLTAGYGSSSPLDAALVTSHTVTLSGLQPNTTYHYRVKSKDAAGNLAASGDFSFTTNALLQGNVAFANVQDIFNNNCVRCHQGAGAPAELVLLPGQSRAQIVNVPSVEYPQWQRVQPGNRAVSWLYEKITNPKPLFGSKMENLSADEIELIGKWIDQGATETPVPPYVDLQFRTTALANAEVNVAYNLGLVVWGGLPPYRFSLIDGTLPPGLDLEPTAGMIVGAATAAGSYNFTIRVSDSQTPAATLDQAYTIQVLNTQAHWQVPAGFKVENVVSDLYLPVNIAFVPNPGPNPDDPYFYVTLLYGEIVMVQRDFQKQTYASGLLNFSPTGEFPGSGEWGVTGITVDPASGDVFASMVYEDPRQSGYVFNKVERFHSADGGRTAATQTTIFSNIYAGVSHQIQAVTIGPDGKLYVNIGDGWMPEAAPDITDLRGKVLRMNLDGSLPDDNPFPGSYVYVTGLRNPFGADWRAADGKLYISDNGPASEDRLAKILPGEDYGWRLESPDLTKGAIFLWTPTVSPVGMDFLENDAFASNYQGQLFVGLSGPTYWHGPTERGKKIQRFQLDANGNVESESIFLDYVGNGKATVIGVAFGPDGLYFTDLYGENGFDEFGQVHGNIYRIRWVGTTATALDVTALTISQIRVDSVSTSRALIKWSTNKPAASFVDFGVTANYGETAADTNLVTEHQVWLYGLSSNATYYFRVRSRDAAGNEAASGDRSFFQTGPSGVVSRPNAGTPNAAVLPTAFALQNYPNPFNAATHVRFALPQDSEIQLAVFDIGGRRVHELFNGSRPAGNHEVIWDGRDQEGNELSSGIYLVRLRYRRERSGAWSQIVQRVMMMK